VSETVTYWQLSWGGLFDGRPADSVLHLVRQIRTGTPGPTLCGIDRFNPSGPGGGWCRSRLGTFVTGKPWPMCLDCIVAMEARL
jgi:hypothetical protein